MSISATIPVSLVAQANAELDALGFGHQNFSVAMKSSGESATHGGLHCWPNTAFEQALNDMVASGNYAGLTLGEDFQTLATDQALEWTDPTNWTQNPVMKGDQRTFSNKLWESLVDYNVWTPPTAWREVVSQGYPAWVQPTGAHDAYALGARVSHQGQDWESTTAANVWQPGVFGWTAI